MNALSVPHPSKQEPTSPRDRSESDPGVWAWASHNCSLLPLGPNASVIGTAVSWGALPYSLSAEIGPDAVIATDEPIARVRERSVKSVGCAVTLQHRYLKQRGAVFPPLC